MAARALMGVETEYALTAIAEDGIVVDRSSLMELLFARAREALPHVRDCSTGLFLANGARLYLDRGFHPEYATPECGDPWEVVRHIRAGERILLDLAERVKAVWPRIKELSVYRSNVDYDRGGTTWGCHESYLHRTNPAMLPAQLIPHFVSRIVYAGAGGFNPLVPGAEFTLSPRAWLLPNVTARDSTGERGIFHFRDEALAGPRWERLHAICGESLCSDTAAVLKLGTTAVILAAIQSGKTPGTKVQLASPVHALRRIALQGRNAGVELEGGGTLTAVEIQRHYLAEVERCRPADLPEWTPELCHLWKAQLDALERDDPSLDRTLDWTMKRAVYRRWVQRIMSWKRFEHLSNLVETMERVAIHRLQVDGQPVLGIAAMLANGETERRHRERLAPLLDSEGTTWDDVGRFFELKNQLLEADLRFGQLGEQGIFTQLDGQGLLTHRLNRPEPSGDPVATPPAGRAAVRGRWIGQLWKQRSAQAYRSDWSVMWNEQTGQHLDLSDPFVTAAEWR